MFCDERGYRFRDRIVNLPVSGLLFRSSKNVVMTGVVDALDAAAPFIFAGVSARGRRLRGLKLIMLPLPRPVPNMVLLSATGNVLKHLGIALKESQRLTVEGTFQSVFTLYCPAEYERDALYVFTPDLMGRLMDAAAGCDMEIVDDRVLIYAPPHAFSKPGQLDALPGLAQYLHEKFERQTRRYRDERRTDEALDDPFRRAQVTTSRGTEERHLVGASGRRLRTRTTAWQKVGITAAATLALSAALYWIGMVATAMFAAA
ncbi:hypothetical protein SAMN05443544_2181 [Agromyces cerinus subsp. cerinus]|uniref:Uncharacterized protein n=2 Tax=Agromyces cerinus TaxID=33878 RepID=A0A1N6FZX6_9MICO|nr:hypothetical protein SAMN05443544_2181 [Agromyces cerinus subsp. cerinus]